MLPVARLCGDGGMEGLHARAGGKRGARCTRLSAAVKPDAGSVLPLLLLLLRYIDSLQQRRWHTHEGTFASLQHSAGGGLPHPLPPTLIQRGAITVECRSKQTLQRQCPSA
ncbi:hypothetical protein AAFF_G00202800 [Aldrovandia affinis]|uniref:Uncharacterized protein n=1 Tax=Aldrovandia affinis TaxID=143900 RepID=A0AAD7SWY5_9TELE|nr:hypothetical protein AAFF_G00202800 [Aldrovandia affinis]